MFALLIASCICVTSSSNAADSFVLSLKRAPSTISAKVSPRNDGTAMLMLQIITVATKPVLTVPFQMVSVRVRHLFGRVLRRLLLYKVGLSSGGEARLCNSLYSDVFRMMVYHVRTFKIC